MGHISPEAWDGGPIAAIRDGDQITIDLDTKTIHVDLTDQEIQERLKHVKRPNHPAPGVLASYRQCVSGSDQGRCGSTGRENNRLSEKDWT